MKVLVDTHTFLWDLNDDSRSSRKARQILSSNEHELFFSLVSLWEIAIKIKTGKLNTIGSSVAYLRDEMEAYGMRLLPIRYEHILQLETLPQHHGDPFDRLLIAQAVTESLPVLTGDRAFAKYDVKVIW
ncbi:type II toxin-antitoxin system VapC family toxin [soil metagenome]